LTTIEIRAASTVDEIEAAEALFDERPHAASMQRFLDERTHHLLLAYQDGVNEPIGFVSGVEVTHPDKGTEMFIYELAVHESYRRLGAATALLKELAELAQAQGCYGMWVLCDHDNAAGIASYNKAGAGRWDDTRMATWVWRDRP
jgi:ribosomal protein S18 acetylase RimI-like enzyme